MTANLPDNVTAETKYTVKSETHLDVQVHVEIDGSVWITQAEDGHVVLPADAIPGLIAALQAAGGVTEPQGPAWVVDNGGYRWHRHGDGTYTMIGAVVDGLKRQPLDTVAAEFGIRETA